MVLPSSSFASSTAVSKESAEIADVTNDGRPIETPLSASPGTIIYGPAISRGAQWDRVKVQGWHTDSVTRICTIAWIDTDGSTVVATRTVAIDADAGEVFVVGGWRMRNGAYLAMWWDASDIGWCKVEQDQELSSGAR